VIYSFVGNVIFCLAVSIYFFSWLDITLLIRYLGQQGTLTDEAIKMNFNRCEWRLLYGLWVTQILFASAGIYNIVVWSVKDPDTVSFLIEACLYFLQVIIEIIVSVLFIVTLKTQRSSLWSSKKVEVSLFCLTLYKLLSISAIITISYMFKVIERIYVFKSEPDAGDNLWYL